MIFHTRFKQIQMALRLHFKTVFVSRITAEHQDCPVFTVFLTIKGKIGNDLAVDIRCIDPEKPHPASLILSTIVLITPGFVIHWSENKT